MAASQPPTENLPAFNSTVFKDANTESLSLSKAQSLFLGRTGNPTSIATTTTFTSDILVNGVKVGKGAAGANNTVLGANAVSGINSGTAIGASSNTGNSNATALGATAQALFNNSTSIGYGSVAAASNTVNLGTISETVYCKGDGLTNSTGASLIATSDIFVKGTIRAGMGLNTTYTTPATSFNTCLGVDTLSSALLSVRGCTAVGYKALAVNQNGINSTAVGANALLKMTGGGSSTAVGTDALQAFVSGAGNNTAIGERAGYASTGSGNNVFVGYYAGSGCIGASDNVCVGSNFGSVNTNQTGLGNTFVGSKVVCGGTSVASSTALGYQASVATFSNSTVIGAGATATAANQIVLGRSTESVIIPGTGTSLTTSGDISAVGTITSTDVGGMNSRVYNLDEYDATANTPYVGALLQQGSIGSLRIYNNKVGGTTPVATELYISTMTAAKVSVDSMVISSADIDLKLPVTLQSTYSAAAGAGQLGQRILLTSVSIPTITTATPVSFGSLVLPAGVWAVDFTVELSNTVASTTATTQTFYFSTSNGGAYGTRIANTGTVRVHSSNTYGNGDNPAFSGSGSFYTQTGTTIYPTVLINYSGGTLTGTGWASATRIG